MMAGKKRKHDEEPPSGMYNNKSRSRPSVEARVDPTYGQRSAIPGLDDDTRMEGEDDELNYDEDMDALAYLRSVRHEASGIPNLLVAPRTPPAIDNREIYEEVVIETGGWYEDGAYVASSLLVPDGSDASEEEADPQLRYFDSILSRYETLRDQLQQMPPSEAVENLGDNHPTYVGKLNTALAKSWRWKMRTVDPKPAQVASMDKSTVLKLLGLMTGGTLLKRGLEVQVGVSRWAWALLARLPERGELTSEEIGIVRELGKKAVLVGTGLINDISWEESLDEVEEGFGMGRDADEEEDSVQVNNEDEIQLDLDDEIDDLEVSGEPEHIPAIDPAYTHTVPSLSPTESRRPIISEDHQKLDNDEAENSEISAGLKIANSVEDGEITPEECSDTAGSLAAAKARILGLLDQNTRNDADDREKEELDQAEATRQSTKWNTKATVDMIITIAGEAYGQRDLLEFRSSWRDVM